MFLGSSLISSDSGLCQPGRHSSVYSDLGPTNQLYCRQCFVFSSSLRKGLNCLLILGPHPFTVTLHIYTNHVWTYESTHTEAHTPFSSRRKIYYSPSISRSLMLSIKFLCSSCPYVILFAYNGPSSACCSWPGCSSFWFNKCANYVLPVSSGGERVDPRLSLPEQVPA